MRKLVTTVLAEGASRPAVLAAVLVVAAALVMVEALLMRGLLDLVGMLSLSMFNGSWLSPDWSTFFAALVLLDLPIAGGIAAARARARTAPAGGVSAQGANARSTYFQSRPTSDMAERCHRLHTLRQFPSAVAQTIRALSVLTATVLGLLWLAPSAAFLVLPLLALALRGAASILQPILNERDVLRFRTQAGALTRFYLDALLGITPIRSHSATRAVHVEHESMLVEWWRTGHQLLRTNLWIGGLQGVIASVLALTLIVHYLHREGEQSHVLLLAFWAMGLPALAHGFVKSLQVFPAYRSSSLRLLDPLGAPDDAAPSIRPAARPIARAQALPSACAACARMSAGALILDEHQPRHRRGRARGDRRARPARASPVWSGLLLGWRRHSEGSLLVDGAAARFARLREQTAWLDPTLQLWNDTLFNNIVYGARENSTAHMSEVLAPQ